MRSAYCCSMLAGGSSLPAVLEGESSRSSFATRPRFRYFTSVKHFPRNIFLAVCCSTEVPKHWEVTAPIRMVTLSAPWGIKHFPASFTPCIVRHTAGLAVCLSAVCLSAVLAGNPCNFFLLPRDWRYFSLCGWKRLIIHLMALMKELFATSEP